jgi:UV DNA damage endonuclease
MFMHARSLSQAALHTLRFKIVDSKVRFEDPFNLLPTFYAKRCSTTITSCRTLSASNRSSLIRNCTINSSGQDLIGASRLPSRRTAAIGPVFTSTLPTLDQLYQEKLELTSFTMATRSSAKDEKAAAATAGASNPTTPNVAPTKRRKRRQQKDSNNNAGISTSATATAIATSTVEEKEEILEEEATTTVTVVKKQRKKREPDPLPCTDPTPELLRFLEEINFTPAPLAVPNLGYACLCMELRELNPPVFTSRDCIKRTLDTKGVSHLGELTLANCKDLARVIQYNQEKNIRFFRMSSVLQPWMGVHDIKTFPQFDEICIALKFAGDLARKYGQRLTFHPSHFVKLAAETDALVQKSIAELEAHSFLLDLMGFTPATPENKINIHVGGVYGDKTTTLQRWAENYKKLSPNCRARVTVENDDVASAYSVDDLLILHDLCDRTLPIVFDFHHYKFCPGELTQEQALRAAVATWPQGVRPVVHWSESQRGRKPHAHSDYVRGPIFLHGLEAEVDVMIESKCKERALLAYRDGLPIPDDDEAGADSGYEGVAGVDAETALKFL